MYELFFQKLNEKVAFTNEEQKVITGYLTSKKLRKKQYLLQAGDVCKAIAFVEKGAMREYSVDESGAEHILQFALEGWLISDLYSFMTGEPATYNIDALEDCDLVLLTKSAQGELLKKVPKFETYTTAQITGAYLAMQKRVNAMISLTPGQRYLYFINLYPNIARRVPQHMIASYLGLSPETLSRIRKRLAAAQ
ncbi:Crp/Fnr family transcriptional regulator [Mucilaginibacter sp.]|uniref:Crp/Fnr family transcriptional regulator n=1 Tax=Mucilaginibacter sp. TaxID=1882438 RepID=UPI00283E1BA6|nr:Crp/Fnr family transcriptional regulator [Mucilaginibacter sp.]MDR3696785.1 Crp/Fnr family transcriptional regulator [Mucilaginibacter sp.]